MVTDRLLRGVDTDKRTALYLHDHGWGRCVLATPETFTLYIVRDVGCGLLHGLLAAAPRRRHRWAGGDARRAFSALDKRAGLLT